MIPILYDKGETTFASNGLGRLADCLSCTVTEERNGIYECQFQYPVTGEMYPEIIEGRIIGVIHDDAQDVQPFDIYSRSAPLNGVVTFYAHHISYRLGNIILKPMTAASCAAAFNDIPNQTYTECPFTFWTDKAVSATWTNEVPSPVKAILGGQEGSILDVYGKGEYEWDKWLVRLYVNRGNDNGVSIRYGVNLTDLTQELDTSTAYTAVVPYWLGREGELVTLPEGYVAMDDMAVVPVPLDLSSAFETAPTVEQLRTKATDVLTSSEAWLPKENIRISFVDLSHTEEYKDVAALQRVRLCDRVSVYCGPLGVSAVSMQVVRVVYNVLTERYDEIELGKAKVSFAQTITASVEEITKDLPSVSMMQRAIDNATDQITGANGGHVRFVYDANGDPQEILIMDTDDISTATNIWRWNSGGLGFSSNGYAGPYSTAITSDGQIVADFITTGSLDANLLKSGVIDGDYVAAKLLNIVDDNNAVLASFKNIVTIGKSGNARIRIGSNYLNFIDAFNGIYFRINDNRGEDGTFEYTETLTAYENVYHNFVVLTKYKIAGSGYYSDYRNIKSITVNGNVLDPYLLRASLSTKTDAGDVYYTEVCGNDQGFRYFEPGDVIAITYDSDVPKYNYNLGKRKSGVEIGSYSIVSGYDCSAAGLYSTALGVSCDSAGKYSYSRGHLNSANGYCSTAIGQSNEANGNLSVVCGESNIANGVRQFVFGKYNEASSGDEYVEIVGNGTKTSFQTNRSNARTLDWNGNEWIAGALSVGNVSKTLQNLGISTGALVSGVKGNAESTYRTGTVNLTPANIGALPASTTYVSGVKGNAESSYRSGQVNITPANLGAVAKAGDTMTGNLGVKATWPSVLLYANGGTQETGAITSHRDNGRVYITEHSTDGTKEEYYQLPIADSSGTYGILTTKVPVTSAQGGTGGPFFFTCSGKTSLVVKSSNGWGGFAVLSITASSAHLTAVGFNGSNAPNAVNIYGGDAGLNPQLSSSNTISCTLRSDRHYIIIGTDKVTSITAS